MGFDRSARRHRPSVAQFDLGRFDVFQRGDDGTIEHFWSLGEGEGVMFGPEPLGGHFDTDPIAIRGATSLHLIGRSGVTIVDWRWDAVGAPGRLGIPQVETLPGLCATEPTVVGLGGAVHVFAVGLEGRVRHWEHGPDGWAFLGSLTGDTAATPVTAVSRSPGILDVFSLSTENHRLAHWSNAEGAWTFETRATDVGVVGRPTVASYEALRLDVFAVRGERPTDLPRPTHWGWNGTRWFDDEQPLDMTLGNTLLSTLRDIQIVEFGVDRITLFARTMSGDPEEPIVGDLVEWTLQPPDRWSGPNPIGDGKVPFTAWSEQEDRLDVLTRDTDGGFTHLFFVNDPSGGMGEPVAGSWEAETFILTEPEPDPATPSPVPLEPDVLLLRPRDLVLLGVRWSGFDLQTGAGGVAELIASAGAELTVLFPPQHIAEEVVPPSGPLMPGIDPSQTGGFPTWRAALSGASRVVVSLAEGERMPLTAEGVLGALRQGRLLPSEGVLDKRTALEIPFGLVISPQSPDLADIHSTHPAALVASENGANGLWLTTIAVADTPAGAPAGLALRAIAARPTDPFEVPLTRGSRGRIVLEPPTVGDKPTTRIERLQLSALGGSLAAGGSWETFEWEHAAALGRDRRVRTATRGVLYPFGHRAEYVEVTERVFDSTAGGGIAHLRKATSLRILEPARREGDGLERSAAFPFSAVEFERTFFENLDDTWVTESFPLPEEDGLLAVQAQLSDLARDLYERIFGEMGPGANQPAVEDLAAGEGEGAENLLDEDDPESQTRSSAALSFLGFRAQMAHIDEQLAILDQVAPLEVNAFFVPRLRRDPNAPPGEDPAPLRFPVRLAGRLGDLHVAMPVVFVADIRLDRGLVTPAFDSLTDTRIQEKVAAAYRATGDGEIDTGGSRIDLVRSDQPVDGDSCEVLRLHVVGEPDRGRFRARLGAAPDAGEARVPAPSRWGFEAALPAVRTLIGDDRPLRLALSRELLDRAPDLQIPFQLPADVEKLATDFAKNSARSGGIVAPDIVADGISRLHGPVSVEGLLDRVGGMLDPKKILSDSATLLGFKLSDLIDATGLEDPPAMLSGLRDGAPVVTLQWRDIPLATETGSFVTGPDSKIDLDVSVGATGQTITCTVAKVVLALPDRAEATKLIEVSLDRVVFTQRDGQAPSLEVDGVDAKFFGLLNLLKELQEAVDLGGSAPKIEASSKGVSAAYSLPVPDVTAGMFQMTNLVFSAGIDVPFDERPVTISLAFASRAKPFNLSVLMFGGGGYADVVIDKTGLRKLEVALEFGASVAIDFVVAFGEVHALGGVRLLLVGDDIELTGYLRFGGSVSILGLVTASVELTVGLQYRSATNQMVGRAKLVLEIDLTLISESVELDTGDWVIAGGSGGPTLAGAPRGGEVPIEAAREDWSRYREAFAAGSVQ
jgi:hypothetical protein